MPDSKADLTSVFTKKMICFFTQYINRQLELFEDLFKKLKGIINKNNNLNRNEEIYNMIKVDSIGLNYKGERRQMPVSDDYYPEPIFIKKKFKCYEEEEVNKEKEFQASILNCNINQEEIRITSDLIKAQEELKETTEENKLLIEKNNAICKDYDELYNNFIAAQKEILLKEDKIREEEKNYRKQTDELKKANDIISSFINNPESRE